MRTPREAFCALNAFGFAFEHNFLVDRLYVIETSKVAKPGQPYWTGIRKDALESASRMVERADAIRSCVSDEIPDYRLVETLVANGNYAEARKHLLDFMDRTDAEFSRIPDIKVDP